jgi:hypothetical protein
LITKKNLSFILYHLFLPFFITFLQMQSLIVSGKLPCTKEECASLAAIQLRVFEINYARLLHSNHEQRRLKREAKEAKATKSENKSTVTEENVNKAEVELAVGEQNPLLDNNDDKKRGDEPKPIANVSNIGNQDVCLLAELAIGDERNVPVLVNGPYESFMFFLKSCSCLSSEATKRVLTLKQLVAPGYHRSNDIVKLIKVSCFFFSYLFYRLYSIHLR